MAEFTINIVEAVDPVAVEDFYEVFPNSTTIFTVLDNDFLGQEPTTLTVEIVPSNGAATVVGGDTIEYIPTNGYVGTDTFYYRITDNNANSSIARVNIEIG